MAVITQVSSMVLKKPFIHFFEAPYGESKVKTLSSQKIKNLASSYSKKQSTKDIATVVSEVRFGGILSLMV